MDKECEWQRGPPVGLTPMLSDDIKILIITTILVTKICFPAHDELGTRGYVGWLPYTQLTMRAMPVLSGLFHDADFGR
jgi:hypothetical protein